jgi:hypothetical protein
LDLVRDVGVGVVSAACGYGISVLAGAVAPIPFIAAGVLFVLVLLNRPDEDDI